MKLNFKFFLIILFLIFLLFLTSCGISENIIKNETGYKEEEVSDDTLMQEEREVSDETEKTKIIKDFKKADFITNVLNEDGEEEQISIATAIIPENLNYIYYSDGFYFYDFDKRIVGLFYDIKFTEGNNSMYGEYPDLSDPYLYLEEDYEFFFTGSEGILGGTTNNSDLLHNSEFIKATFSVGSSPNYKDFCILHVIPEWGNDSYSIFYNDEFGLNSVIRYQTEDVLKLDIILFNNTDTLVIISLITPNLSDEDYLRLTAEKIVSSLKLTY